MDRYIIIKSFIKNEENWDGKGFSHYPAKIYQSFSDASGALESYWFNDYCQRNGADTRTLKMIFLSEYQKNKLLKNREITF